MHKRLLPGFILAGMMLSGVASAAPVSNGGTIHFTGLVETQPCVITQNTADQTISLGSVATGALVAKGGTSAKVPFSITLEGCDTTTINTASFAFTGVASAGDPQALSNSGDASNVGVQLQDSTGAILPLDASSSFDLTLASTTQNTADFTAYMIATDNGASAGTVDTQATFEISYN